jgi:serine protease inhibitor
MGIRDLFTSRSKLYLFDDNQKLSVDQAIQQSSLEIDENGSIGATVTAFSVVPLMVQPIYKDSELVVDRPFVAIIIDRKFGVPYFMAKVSDPRET